MSQKKQNIQTQFENKWIHQIHIGIFFMAKQRNQQRFQINGYFNGMKFFGAIKSDLNARVEFSWTLILTNGLKINQIVEK